MVREAVKIFVLSFKELDKYECLTDRDLGYKPGVIEQFFNKELKESDKKEGLLKRLKNIAGKKEEQLK